MKKDLLANESRTIIVTEDDTLIGVIDTILKRFGVCVVVVVRLLLLLLDCCCC
jgi:hypothetical protein